MTFEDENELKEATQSYSDACKQYRQINRWYKGLKNPKPEEEMVFLSVKKRMSITGKALYDIRTRIEGQEMIKEVNATAPQSIEELIQSILSVQSNQIKRAKEEALKAEIIKDKKQRLIDYMKTDRSVRIAVCNSMDQFIDEHGYCEPYGERLTPEAWEFFVRSNFTEIEKETSAEDQALEATFTGFDDIDKKET